MSSNNGNRRHGGHHDFLRGASMISSIYSGHGHHAPPPDRLEDLDCRIGYELSYGVDGFVMDRNAIASDWAWVGQDIGKALEKYGEK